MSDINKLVLEAYDVTKHPRYIHPGGAALKGGLMRAATSAGLVGALTAPMDRIDTKGSMVLSGAAGLVFGAASGYADAKAHNKTLERSSKRDNMTQYAAHNQHSGSQHETQKNHGRT